MRDQIPENSSVKQSTLVKSFSAGFNKFLDKIYHYDFVEHELKENREKYSTADWTKKSPYVSRSPHKIPLDAAEIRKELNQSMELSKTRPTLKRRLQNYFFPQDDNLKINDTNFFNMAYVNEPQKKEECVACTKKTKPSRGASGGAPAKGKSVGGGKRGGGGIKMLALKLMIGLGAVYGSNMLGMWGSVQDSEQLMEKLKSFVPPSNDNSHNVSPKKGK